MVLTYLDNNKNQNLIACVGDSYDIFNFTDFVTKGEIKDKIDNWIRFGNNMTKRELLAFSGSDWKKH